MTIFFLQQVGDYVRTGKAPNALLSILHHVRVLITFPQERANRYKRFIKIARAYKSGKPIAEIEREFGCNRSTILRYARLAGLDKRPKGFGTERRDETIRLYKEGIPISEISVRLGVSQAYVSKLATEEGINRRIFKSRKRES